MTRRAFENAITIVIALGGSTNAVLEIATPRTVVLTSVQDCVVTSTSAAEGGELFV